jgi:putative hydrolase of the HAD superfamily
MRAIIFDLDDTLHDKSATLSLVASRQFASARLFELDADENAWKAAYLSLNNLRIEKTEVFARLSEQFGLKGEVERSLREEFDRSLGRHAVAFDGALALVQVCKSHGMKIGIVTNGRDAFQRSKIDGLQLTPLIDSIVTSGGLGIKKPDHRIFQTSLAELDVSANDAVFIGDDWQADMLPALAMGMQAIWKSSDRSGKNVAFCSNNLSDIASFLFPQN